MVGDVVAVPECVLEVPCFAVVEESVVDSGFMSEVDVAGEESDAIPVQCGPFLVCNFGFVHSRGVVICEVGIGAVRWV